MNYWERSIGERLLIRVFELINRPETLVKDQMRVFSIIRPFLGI